MVNVTVSEIETGIQYISDTLKMLKERLGEMKVGDSRIIDGHSYQSIRTSMYKAISMLPPGRKYVSKKINAKSIRVWRAQ